MESEYQPRFILYKPKWTEIEDSKPLDFSWIHDICNIDPENFISQWKMDPLFQKEEIIEEQPYEQPPPSKSVRGHERTASKLHAILGDGFMRDFAKDSPKDKDGKQEKPQTPTLTVTKPRIEEGELRKVISTSFRKLTIASGHKRSPSISQSPQSDEDPRKLSLNQQLPNLRPRRLEETPHGRSQSIHISSPRHFSLFPKRLFGESKTDNTESDSISSGNGSPEVTRKYSNGDRPLTPRLKTPRSISPQSSPRNSFLGVFTKAFWMKSSDDDIHHDLEKQALDPEIAEIVKIAEGEFTDETFPKDMTLEERLWHLGFF